MKSRLVCEVKRAKAEHKATEIELETVIEHGLRVRVFRKHDSAASLGPSQYG